MKVLALRFEGDDLAVELIEGRGLLFPLGLESGPCRLELLDSLNVPLVGDAEGFALARQVVPLGLELFELLPGLDRVAVEALALLGGRIEYRSRLVELARELLAGCLRFVQSLLELCDALLGRAPGLGGLLEVDPQTVGFLLDGVEAADLLVELGGRLLVAFGQLAGALQVALELRASRAQLDQFFLFDFVVAGLFVEIVLELADAELRLLGELFGDSQLLVELEAFLLELGDPFLFLPQLVELLLGSLAALLRRLQKGLCGDPLGDLGGALPLGFFERGGQADQLRLQCGQAAQKIGLLGGALGEVGFLDFGRRGGRRGFRQIFDGRPADPQAETEHAQDLVAEGRRVVGKQNRDPDRCRGVEEGDRGDRQTFGVDRLQSFRDERIGVSIGDDVDPAIADAAQGNVPAATHAAADLAQPGLVESVAGQRVELILALDVGEDRRGRDARLRDDEADCFLGEGIEGRSQGVQSV